MGKQEDFTGGTFVFAAHQCDAGSGGVNSGLAKVWPALVFRRALVGNLSRTVLAKFPRTKWQNDLSS
jgi:hypothetical protein